MKILGVTMQAFVNRYKISQSKKFMEQLDNYNFFYDKIVK